MKLRKFQLTNKNTNTNKVISHYQIIDWMDGEIPKNKNKKWINLLINDFLG